MAQQTMDDEPFVEMRKPTDKEKRQITREFRKLDHNGDGRLAKHEVKRILCHTGINPTDEEIDEIMGSADANGDDYVTRHEFEIIWMRAVCRKESEKKRIMGAFEMFDKNGDGYITEEELKTILSAGGGECVDEEVQGLIKEADVNRDGKISYEEFANMFCDQC